MEPFVCRHPKSTVKLEPNPGNGVVISIAGPSAVPALVEVLTEYEATQLRDWLLARYPTNPS